jgi:hypothetical protein
MATARIGEDRLISLATEERPQVRVTPKGNLLAALRSIPMIRYPEHRHGREH